MSTQRSLFGRIADTVRPSRVKQRERRDRIAGALLGVHVGDSLGATHEFATGPNIGPQTRDIIGGGTFNWEAGQPTDDTDLTLAVMRAHLAHPHDDDAVVRDAADRMVAWMESGPRDIGGTTRRTLTAVKQGVPLHATGATGEFSAANGSLMRCIPTGALIANPARRRELTDRIGAVTHALPVCRSATVVYNDTVANLIDGHGFPDAIRDAIHDNPDLHPEVRDALIDVIDAGPGQPMPVEYGNKQGWVIGSLRTAVWAAMQPDAEQALIDVANAGGDADTNGAIAGGLIGAKVGVSGIPERWRDMIWHHDEMVDAAQEFADRRDAEVQAIQRTDRPDDALGTMGGGLAGHDRPHVGGVACGARTSTGGSCQRKVTFAPCPHHGTPVRRPTAAASRGRPTGVSDVDPFGP